MISFSHRPPRAKGQNSVINCTISIIGSGRGIPFSIMKVKPAIARLFDNKAERFKGDLPENAILDAVEAKIKRIYALELQKGNKPTAKELKTLYLTEGNQVATTYEEVSEEHLHFTELREGKDLGHRSIETYHVYYKTFLNYLADTKNKGISIEKISIPLLKGYERLLIGKKYSQEHIKKSVRYVISVLRFAVNNGFLKHNQLSEYQFEWYSKSV
ncbi:MAG: phage integrase SAM-like domain-containing protein, partial [Thermoflexibacter sp.]|nr:phage integrase SAM-like domain-containing protein [Thermoflexibacter sp.]